MLSFLTDRLRCYHFGNTIRFALAQLHTIKKPKQDIACIILAPESKAAALVL